MAGVPVTVTWEFGLDAYFLPLAQRAEQGSFERLVMGLADAVLAVVAAELGEEGDGLLCSLGDELVTQPCQRLGEDVSLLLHVGREQVARGEVGGEPAGVEIPDQHFGLGARTDGGAQNAHRLPVFESHAARS